MPKFHDQLREASLENVAGNPTLLPTGKFWIDTTTAVGLPKFHNGTEVKEFVTVDATQTFTNKTIAAASNTISGLQHGTHVDEPAAAHGVTTIAGLVEVQTFTNKKLDGGTASANNEWILPKDTTVNLDLLADVQASFGYDTTTDKPVFNTGAGWQVIGGASLLNELSDVVELSSTEGQQLIHDGSTYVNADMANNNLVINGCMKIMQRADYDTTPVVVVHNTFTLDRWKTKIGIVTANTQRLSTGQPAALTTSKSLRLTATSTATGNIGYRTFIEMDDTFINKTLTLSAYVKSNNANTRLGYYNGTSTVYSATSHTGGGGWELLTITYTMSGSLATTMCQVGVYTVSAAGADVAISTNDYLELTGVGLYFGSIAYPFQPRLIADEYNRCQRYYFKTYDYGVYAGASSVNGLLVEQGGDNVVGNTNTSSTFNFPVGMRISPVITYYDQVGNASRVTYGIANGTITNNQNPTLTAAASNANQARFGITLPAGNNGFQMHFVADAE